MSRIPRSSKGLHHASIAQMPFIPGKKPTNHLAELQRASVSVPLLLPLPVPYAVRVVNAYLLLGEPLTLVDPGADWPDTRSELEAGLAAHGLRVEDVERLVITHQHHDHVGLAHWIKERSGADLVAHGGIVDHLARLSDESMEAEDQFQ